MPVCRPGPPTSQTSPFPLHLTSCAVPLVLPAAKQAHRATAASSPRATRRSWSLVKPPGTDARCTITTLVHFGKVGFALYPHKLMSHAPTHACTSAHHRKLRLKASRSCAEVQSRRSARTSPAAIVRDRAVTASAELSLTCSTLYACRSATRSCQSKAWTGRVRTEQCRLSMPLWLANSRTRPFCTKGTACEGG